MEKNVSSVKEEIMIENVSGVYLRIFTKVGIYDIPYKNIEQLDNFTVHFINKKDLINKLFGKNSSLIDNVEISYSFSKDGKTRTQKLPIKFLDDNFDEHDLRSKYRKYLENNGNKIYLNKWKINYAITNGRIKSGRGGDITTSELDKAVADAWGKGYKTKRDIYFALKNEGIDVEILPTFPYEERQLSLNDKIKGIDSGNPYIEYLQSSLNDDPEKRAFVMEQLSMFDLDSLENIKAPFDGVSASLDLDILTDHLKTLTPAKRKLLCDEIEKIRNDFFKSCGKKKCLK